MWWRPAPNTSSAGTSRLRPSVATALATATIPLTTLTGPGCWSNCAPSTDSRQSQGRFLRRTRELFIDPANAFGVPLLPEALLGLALSSDRQFSRLFRRVREISDRF